MPPPNPLPLNNQAALQEATQSAAAISDPSNPLGSTLAPALTKISDIGQENLSTGAAANAAVGEAQMQVAAQKAAEAAKKDPNKYTRVQAPDGGWNFFGPDGKPVSAAQYASVLGTNPAQVLQDSQNPIDIAFQQDYNQLQKYFQDKLNANTDETAAAEAKAIEDKVKENYGIDLAKQNHQQVVQSFMQAYPTVFGLTTTGKQGTNALLPNQNYLDAQAEGAAGGSVGG